MTSLARVRCEGCAFERLVPFSCCPELNTIWSFCPRGPLEIVSPRGHAMVAPGRKHMPVCSPIPVLGLSAVQSRAFRILVGKYERRLVRIGYHPTVVRLHLHSIAHLGVWIEREGRSLEIDAETPEVFGRHRPTCTCPGTSRNPHPVRRAPAAPRP
jgi:hypothetical protein